MADDDGADTGARSARRRSTRGQSRRPRGPRRTRPPARLIAPGSGRPTPTSWRRRLPRQSQLAQLWIAPLRSTISGTARSDVVHPLARRQLGGDVTTDLQDRRAVARGRHLDPPHDPPGVELDHSTGDALHGDVEPDRVFGRLVADEPAAGTTTVVGRRRACDVQRSRSVHHVPPLGFTISQRSQRLGLVADGSLAGGLAHGTMASTPS